MSDFVSAAISVIQHPATIVALLVFALLLASLRRGKGDASERVRKLEREIALSDKQLPTAKKAARLEAQQRVEREAAELRQKAERRHGV